MDGGEGMQLVLESLGLCPSIPPPFIKDGTVMSQECWYVALVAAARETELQDHVSSSGLWNQIWVTQGDPIPKQKQTTNQLSKQNLGMVLTT